MKKLALVVSLLMPSLALGCTVIPAETDVAVKWSDKIFIGKVLKIEKIGERDRNLGQEIAITLETSEWFKGAPEKEIVVYSTVGGMCSFGEVFTRGQTYLVSAHYVDPKEYWSGKLSNTPTQMLRNGAGDLTDYLSASAKRIREVRILQKHRPDLFIVERWAVPRKQ